MSVKESKHLNRFNEVFNEKNFFIDFNNLDDAFIDVSNEYLHFLKTRKGILDNIFKSIEIFEIDKIPYSGLCSFIKDCIFHYRINDVIIVTSFIQNNPPNIYDGPRSYVSSYFHFPMYDWVSRRKYLMEVINLNDLLIEEVAKRLEKL